MIKRITKEIKDQKNFSQDLSFWQISENDYFNFIGAISGTKNSPYEDGIFYLRILLCEKYPFYPPKFVFITKIYHPLVNSNGEICLSLLLDEWWPPLTIRKILSEIQKLLTDFDSDDSLASEIGCQYKTDRDKFERIARKWTKTYAM